MKQPENLAREKAAFAAGKRIQFRNGMDVKDWTITKDPQWAAFCEYRVDPSDDSASQDRLLPGYIEHKRRQQEEDQRHRTAEFAARYLNEILSTTPEPPKPNTNMNQNTLAQSAALELPARKSKWALVDCGDTEIWKVKSAGPQGIYLSNWYPWNWRKLITVSDWNSRTKTQLTAGVVESPVTAKPKRSIFRKALSGTWWTMKAAVLLAILATTPAGKIATAAITAYLAAKLGW